jgi:hypothetical protein
MKTSEPLGEGVGVNAAIVTNVDNDAAVVVVEINMSIYYSFVEIRIFDADSGLEIRIVGVDLVELIGKRSI